MASPARRVPSPPRGPAPAPTPREAERHPVGPPGSHSKFGEDPRDPAKRVGEEVLQITGMTYSEPRVEVDLYPSTDFPGNLHSDLWSLVDATPPKGWTLKVPPWYADLARPDPRP